ncbi:hypothetical protein AMTR_s00127p00055610 [Amborella trichopoda]|uniref:Uncharacterized protein n=1 Tax=Amborella trichopoda TaxID=13333 RepID=W1NNL3_AMBTC|nr:hypothetical protein AMTR_s00127p00055610 [Amborella trichopoda]
MCTLDQRGPECGSNEECDVDSGTLRVGCNPTRGARPEVWSWPLVQLATPPKNCNFGATAEDHRNRIPVALRMSLKTVQMSSKLSSSKHNEKGRAGQQQAKEGERNFWSPRDQVPLAMVLISKLLKSA